VITSEQYQRMTRYVERFRDAHVTMLNAWLEAFPVDGRIPADLEHAYNAFLRTTQNLEKDFEFLTAYMESMPIPATAE
jgi:hypothetical protein